MSGGHCLLFGFALLVFTVLEQGSVLFDFAPQSEGEHFLFAQSSLQLFEQAQHVAQLALHRKRSLAALSAAGDGDVMKALAGLREKESIRAGEREFTRYGRVGHDVSITQLRQNYFQRLAKYVEHANRVLQREDGVVERRVVMAFVRNKRELCL